MDTSRPAPSRSLVRMRRLLLGSALACLVIALFSLPAGPAATLEALLGLGLANWGSVVAAATLAFFIRFLRWHFLVRRTAGAVPVGSSALIFTAGLAMGLTPGKLGETLKAVELAARHDVPLAHGMPVVAVELVTDMVAMSLVTAALFGFVYPGASAIAATGLIVAALLAAALTVQPVADAIASGLAQLGAARAAAKVGETPALIRRVVGWRGMLLATLLAMLAHGAKGLAVVLTVAGLGAALPWHEAVFAYVAPNMAGALAMLPASLGAAEFGLTALIHDLAQPAPPLAIAAAAALVVRLATLWFPLVVGGVALILLRLAPPGRIAAA